MLMLIVAIDCDCLSIAGEVDYQSGQGKGMRKRMILVNRSWANVDFVYLFCIEKLLNCMSY